MKAMAPYTPMLDAQGSNGNGSNYINSPRLMGRKTCSCLALALGALLLTSVALNLALIRTGGAKTLRSLRSAVTLPTYTDIIDDGNRLVAYWDAGSCGPYGDDFQHDWCQPNLIGGTPPNCPPFKMVHFHICPSGWAQLQTIMGHSGSSADCCSDIKMDGCDYAWFARYACTV